MKQKFYFFLLMVLPFIAVAQTPAKPMNLPKDAKVDVTIADAKTGNMLSNEIIVFRSMAAL